MEETNGPKATRNRKDEGSFTGREGPEGRGWDGADLWLGAYLFNRFIYLFVRSFICLFIY